MNPIRNGAKARLSLEVMLLGLSTVRSEQRPQHRCWDAVSNKQVFPHLVGGMRVKKLVQEGRIQMGTWNIGTLKCKLMEVVGVMVKCRISITCLQETKWVGSQAKDLRELGFQALVCRHLETESESSSITP